MAIYGEAYNFKAVQETSHMGQAIEMQLPHCLALPSVDSKPRQQDSCTPEYPEPATISVAALWPTTVTHWA